MNSATHRTQRTIAMLLLWGTLCAGPVIAQVFRIDSMRTRLKTEGRTTMRVDHLIGLAFAISDAESAEEYGEIPGLLDEANRLADELDYAKGLAYAPMAEAFRARAEGRYAESLAGYKACIALLDAAGVEQGILSPLADIRRVYTAAGLQQERHDFYRSALDRYRRTGPAMNAAVCEHGLGGYYIGTRQYGLAIGHYLKAREGLPNDAGNETMVIGQCYLDWGNPERAEVFLREAMSLLLRQRNMDQYAGCLQGLGEITLRRGDAAAALRYFRDTRPYWNILPPINRGIARTRFVEAYIRTGQLDSARLELLALDTMRMGGRLALWTTAGECEVDFVNYLYQKAMGQDAKADSCLRSALNEAVRLRYVPLQLKYRKELSERYQEQGDAVNAAEQARAYIRLSDSLQTRANRTNIAVYENQVKERESALALQQEQARLRQQRIISFAIAGGLLLLVALAVVVYRGKKRSDELLLNILPAEVANELKAKGHADAKHFDTATILFTDFKGFTEASEKLTPQELVEELNTCFKAFDHIITARGIEKIKTIGDAYMCAGGLPDPASSSPADVVHAALEMQAFMVARKTERDAQGKPFFEMRVGIHTGPVVAGIVGVKKFAYDIWGDTVNTASRMESSSEVGQVNISEATYALVKGETGFTFTSRGKVQAKGKGEMEMYFVERADTFT